MNKTTGQPQEEMRLSILKQQIETAEAEEKERKCNSCGVK